MTYSQKQAEHNRNVAEHLDSTQKNCTSFDWICVVRFYTALHCVEDKLTELGFKKPKTHKERKRLLKKAKDNGSIFEDVYDNYLILESWGHKARYRYLFLTCRCPQVVIDGSRRALDIILKHC